MSGERRTAKVLLDMHGVGRLLGLAEGQRVLHLYVTGDPHLLGVVIEGGEELPPNEGYPGRPERREFGYESPIVRAAEIPKPPT